MTRHLAACLLLIGTAAAEAAEVNPRLPIAPPVDPTLPIVLLDFEDGRSASAAQSDLYLAVYADGRAVVSVPGRRDRQISGRIPAEELRVLLNDLVVEHRLLDCHTSQLAESIHSARRQRRRPEPGQEAATTVIRVRSADSAHEIRCHALGLTASQLPDLTQVRDLYACEQRLENVAAIIRAGGYEHVHEVLSAANRQLQQQAPLSEMLTPRDLNLVDLRADGSRYLQFSRNPDIDGLRPERGFVIVSVYQVPGRPPEITVTADPS